MNITKMEAIIMANLTLKSQLDRRQVDGNKLH